jgi:TIR domain
VLPFWGCKTMAKVFLSYAPSDAGSVRQIASAIEDAGHTIKLGRASIDVVDAGGRLAATVFALKNCDVVALALSPNAVKSSAIIVELMLAEQAYKPVIPVVLESIKLPSENAHRRAALVSRLWKGTRSAGCLFVWARKSPHRPAIRFIDPSRRYRSPRWRVSAQGNREMKCRSPLCAVFDPDRSPVALDDGTSDRQSKAGSMRLGRVECVENLVDRLLRDAGTRIAHHYLDFAIRVHCCPDGDVARIGRIVDHRVHRAGSRSRVLQIRAALAALHATHACPQSITRRVATPADDQRCDRHGVDGACSSRSGKGPTTKVRPAASLQGLAV